MDDPASIKIPLIKIHYPTDSLNAHMKSHWETDWLCHLCGKKLMNKRNLIHHYRTHTNEKPFTCGDCDRAFSSKEKLKLHSKTHSGTRAHICTHCNKSFIQKGHLAKHMKVHVSIRTTIQKIAIYVFYFPMPVSRYENQM